MCIQSCLKDYGKSRLQALSRKKYLTDFDGIESVDSRNSNEAYLSDDVSFIIAHNRKVNDTVDVFSLLSIRM